MEAYRIESVVLPNGLISIENVPFEEGESVEVIILESRKSDGDKVHHSLKGSVLRYDSPFEPACSPEDWEALK